MAGVQDNPWGDQLGESENIWDDSISENLDSSNRGSDAEISNEVENVDEELENGESQADQENGDLPAEDIVSVTEKHVLPIDSVWNDQESETIEKDTKEDACFAVDHNKTSTNDIHDNNSNETNFESEIIDRKADNEHNYIQSLESNDQFENESNDDDEFGEFEEIEEIEATKLVFNPPSKDLIESIFPKKFDKENILVIDKSSLFKSDTTLPMKCYNKITADDRQYFLNNKPLLNTRERGCSLKTDIRKQAIEISKEWIFNEKGIKEDVMDNKQKWKEAGKNNIFKWGSVITDNLDEKNVDLTNGKDNGKEKKQHIGTKLINASFREARLIVEKKLEAEKREKLALEELRKKREEKLHKEMEEREQERIKYNNDLTTVKNNDKKKGFFSKMFSSKSNISKDHISHKKVALIENNETQPELSLKEEMERDGYILSENKQKKGKSKKHHRRHRHRHHHHRDNSDGEDESDSDNEVNYDEDVNTFKIIDGNSVLDENTDSSFVNDIFLDSEQQDNNLQTDETVVETNNVAKETNDDMWNSIVYDNEDDDNESIEDRENSESSESDSSTDGASFEEFQTFAAPESNNNVDIVNSNVGPTSSNQNQSQNHTEINLIDL